MSLEIEAKLEVDNCDATRDRLRCLGARWVYTVVETNAIFDTADRQLFARGCGLRVRECKGDGDVPSSTLTYKGAQQAGAFKTRPEFETGLADAAAAKDILKALGYDAVMVFEKRREEWALDGLTVELDEVPRLGCYVEIEGPDEAGVRDLQARLGLGDQPSIRESYIALLIEHARENHLDWHDIRFE